LSLDPTGKPSEPADAKFHTHKLPSDIPPAALQASIEGAFQVAAENYFRGGAFARAMHDTIHRFSTIQTIYRYSRDYGDWDFEKNNLTTALSRDYSTTGREIVRSPKGQRGAHSRVCRRTSATEALFGTICLRTISVRVGPSPGGTVDTISSFTFFPSWWLT